MTPPRIIVYYQCTTQADSDFGSREWFKTVPSIYREFDMNELKDELKWEKVGFELSVEWMKRWRDK